MRDLAGDCIAAWCTRRIGAVDASYPDAAL